MVSDVNKPARRLALLALSSAMAAGFAMMAPVAAHAAEYDGSALRAGTLQVPLNKSQVVSADRPIAKAMIGNEEVADILPFTDRSIYVLGKKMGTTSLTLYDSAGRVLSVLDIAVGPDVESLEAQLRDLVPDEDEDDADTLGGLVFTLVGRVPTRGELVRHGSGLAFEVLEADPRRLKRLKVHPNGHAQKTGKRTGPSAEPSAGTELP